MASAGWSQGTVNVKVRPELLVNKQFIGMGYQYDSMYRLDWNKSISPGYGDQEIADIYEARWLEHQPKFARAACRYNWWQPTQASKTWNSDEMVALYEHLDLLQSTDTTVYLTLWYHNGIGELSPNGNALTDPVDIDAFADSVADFLEHLVVTKGYSNLRYFCIANELSPGEGWGWFSGHMDLWETHNDALFSELQQRGLEDDVLLVGNDAGEVKWWTINAYTAPQMADVTGIYGGHIYPDTTLGEPGVFEYTFDEFALRRDKMRYHYDRVGWVTGEFAPSLKDANGNLLTHEPEFALKAAEMVLAQLNVGVSALAYWDFADYAFREDILDQAYNPKKTWGTFESVKDGFNIHPHYYALGLLSRELPGQGSTVVVAESDDPKAYVSALYDVEGRYTLVLLNRNDSVISADILLENHALDSTFDRFLFEAGNVPGGAALPGPVANHVVSGGSLQVDLPAQSLTVLQQSGGGSLPPAAPSAPSTLRYEAEVSVTRKSGHPHLSKSPSGLVLSEDRYAQFKSELVGDFLEYDVYAPEAGTYTFRLALVPGPDRGIVDISLNDDLILAGHDLYATAPLVEILEFPSIVLAEGLNNLRMEVVGGNPDNTSGFLKIFTDYFEIAPEGTPTGDGLMAEAEDLPAIRGNGWFNQNADNADASNGFFANYGADAVGDFVEFTVELAEPGDYQVNTLYMKNKKRGIARLNVNGTALGADFDGYTPNGAEFVSHDHGVVSFSAGTHLFRYEVVGRNASSNGHFIGVDRIDLLTASIGYEAESLPSSASGG